ncbi:hypothetical protein SERLADRAFT_436577 [Serpula lacrymans var. lacrymans S7.9]|uniref:Uncharacterized protein n=1 Tax=Serpula lacrymans var. lacrymans (strain S7.9) TaxID=578457 RepID=F8NRG3_SERL9|nr:uncharacterized protein SERLADRAFT_436577 [Serpula lacrymans var. lacrymans S7.9]EGO26756.1 hypothetical protein SERLADRAFT_436577 [Serpula lacrymans var. lacrymans S7.9]
MGKYNHIPELAGSDNYLGWKRDPSKPREFASYCPVAVDPLRPTASESKIMDDWILRDCAAKSLISRKVSSTVSKLLPDDVNLTARDCWNTLAAHFHHNASSLQFELHSRMSLLHMKDLDDAERFLSEWKDIAQCFSDLSADSLSDEEAIFNFVGGLPATPTWDTFKSHHTRSLQRASRGIVDIGGVSTPFFVLAIDPSFDLVLRNFSSEVSRLKGERLYHHSTPKFVHTGITHTSKPFPSHSSQPRIHKNNPSLHQPRLCF